MPLSIAQQVRSIGPTDYVSPVLLAFNHKGSAYAIGFGGSMDRNTWSTGLGILTAGAGWESSEVKDPWLIWDGSQFVCFYSGFDGTSFKIGRATASTMQGPWTKYGSNPILSNGGIGDPDEVGCEFPVVSYNSNDSPAWKMWYTGQPSGWTSSNPVSTLCFADSSDGITWTKRGTVVGLGTAGAFNDFATLSGCFYRSASNSWTVYLAGYHDPGTGVLAHSGYCTCTDPASAATYSAVSQLSNYTGNVTVGGRTWQSNLPRGIISHKNAYLAFMTLWKPTDTSSLLETCVNVYSADLTSWTVPTDLMLAMQISTENPSVLISS